MKKAIELLLALTILISFTACVDSATAQKAEAELTTVVNNQTLASSVSEKTLRITVDGTVYQTQAYLDGDKVYLTTDALTKLFGDTPSSSVDINGVPFADAKAAAEAEGVDSYVYDENLDSIYIWTNLPECADFSDRVIHYGLGEPSDEAITYRQFFAVLDKVIEIADESKLNEWQAMLKEARNSNRTMMRMEGMCAILYAAVELGSNYSEFNTNWHKLNDTIGEKVWDEVNAACLRHDPYEYIPNPYPYNLAGFVNAPYIRDGWDLLGVAYRYSYGRISLYNGMSLFDYDPLENSMRLDDDLTVTEALNALSRFLDSAANSEEYISVTDEKATKYNADIITSNLIGISCSMPEISDAHLPVWNAAVIGGDYEMRTIDTKSFDTDARKLSEWGFNCVRYMLTYQTLFSSDASTVNEEALLQLDQIVAIAMRYRIHLNLLTFSLPGRWASTDSGSYISKGEFDLFVNPERQEEAKAVWTLLARRYADIPSSVLSFSPMWETLNYNLSTGLQYTPYTPDDVAAFYVDLVGAIRDEDPDRFIIYEGTAVSQADIIIEQDTPIKEALEDKFDNIQLFTNFCETTYVYAEMTGVSGENVDNNNHSMFKPPYPVSIYASGGTIGADSPMIFNGVLEEGTLLELYLSIVNGRGTLRIIGDGEVLLSEDLEPVTYSTGAPLSGLYCYAKSEKCISVILPRNFTELRVEYSGYALEWSGLDVTLPDKYAVERWWFPSAYDSFLAGAGNAMGPSLLRTSTVQISPNGGNPGVITIHTDVIYTSGEIIAQANKESIQNWGNKIAEFASGSATRCEEAGFSIGTQYDSAIAYYDDFLDMCSTHGIGWFCNDYALGDLMGGQSNFSKYAGAKGVVCDGGYVLKELLELYQSYMPMPIEI